MKKIIKYTAPALEKGLDILELLSQSKNGLTQAEIANKLKRSVNEIYRMLNILIQRKYIEAYKNSDIYNLSYKLLEISLHHQPIKNLIQNSISMMREIAQLCNQSLHLSIYSAGKLLVVAQVDSPSNFNYAVAVGSVFDLLETSSGRVLLSFQNEQERNRRLKIRKFYIKLDKNYHLSSSALKTIENKFSSKTIHEIIKNKYEVVKSLQIKGITNISVPILDNNQNAIAALTIPFASRINSKGDLNIKKTTNILLNYANKLSYTFGYIKK
tara:strand:- start:420 stop:1229 length:810 start_codon:yes stop_codon:yes gene_type:complete